MALLPRKNAECIAFFQTRNTLWNTNATAIGTTTAAVTSLATAVTAATNALAAQLTAQNSAKAATETLDLAMAAMTNQGMAIVEQVRTKARSVGDSVYPLANIPAPKTPTPPAEPGTVNRLKAGLTALGNLDLSWKCTNPTAGTMYQLFRTIGTGTPVYLGGTGEKKFTDTTLPAGASNITYAIQAVRSSGVGAWADFNVKIGGGGTSPLVKAVAHNDSVKLAA